MAIERTNMQISYAYNLQGVMDSSITAIEEGAFIQKNAAGNMVKSDGTGRAYMCLTSKRPNRDNISTQNSFPRLVYFRGPAVVSVYNDEANGVFDASKTYAEDVPLVVDTTGVVRPMLETGETSKFIVGYAAGPVNNGVLTIDIIDPIPV